MNVLRTFTTTGPLVMGMALFTLAACGEGEDLEPPELLPTSGCPATVSLSLTQRLSEEKLPEPRRLQPERLRIRQAEGQSAAFRIGLTGRGVIDESSRTYWCSMRADATWGPLTGCEVALPESLVVEAIEHEGARSAQSLELCLQEVSGTEETAAFGAGPATLDDAPDPASDAPTPAKKTSADRTVFTSDDGPVPGLVKESPDILSGPPLQLADPDVRIEVADDATSVAVRGTRTKLRFSTSGQSVPPAILSLVRALGNDPFELFRYVYERIEADPGAGLKRSPEVVLATGIGTAADQANLLKELAKAAGIGGVKIVNGPVGLSTANASHRLYLESLFGTTNTTELQERFPGHVGFSNATYVAFEHHTWVRMNYQGSATEFDPYFTHRERAPAWFDILGATSYTRTSLYSDANIADNAGRYDVRGRNALRRSLCEYATELGDALDLQGITSVDELFGRSPIKAFDRTGQDLRPSFATFQGFTPTVTNQVPNAEHIRIALSGPGLSATIDAADIASDNVLYVDWTGTRPKIYLGDSELDQGSSVSGDVFPLGVALSGADIASNISFEVNVNRGHYTAVVAAFIPSGTVPASDLVTEASKRMEAGDQPNSRPVLSLLGTAVGSHFIDRVTQTAKMSRWRHAPSNWPHQFQDGTDRWNLAEVIIGSVGVTPSGGVAVDAIQAQGTFGSLFLGSLHEADAITDQFPGAGSVSTTLFFDDILADGQDARLVRNTSDLNQLSGYSSADRAALTSLLSTADLLLPHQRQGAPGSGIILYRFHGNSLGASRIGDLASLSEPVSALNSTEGGVFGRTGEGALPTGQVLATHVDLSTGPEQALLTLIRHYDSASYQQSGVLGRGWGHSYDVRLSERSSTALGFGARTPAEAAPALLASQILNHLEGDLSAVDAEAALVATMVARWAGEYLEDNVVSIQAWAAAETFVRVPDCRGAGSSVQDRWRPAPGSYSVLEFETNGYRVERADRASMRFNASGQLTELRNPQGEGLNLTYANHRLDRVRSTRGSWRLDFDYSNARLDRVTDQSGRNVRYAYNNQDELVGFTDAAGRYIEYDYDTSGRLDRIYVPRQSASATKELAEQYEYDLLGRVQAMEGLPYNDGDPRPRTQWFVAPTRVRVVDNLDREQITDFDPSGRPLRVQDHQQRAVSYTYDTFGRLETTTQTDGTRTVHSYDGRGRTVSTASYPNGSGSPYVTTRQYSDCAFDGLVVPVLAWEQDARGARTDYEYDTDCRLKATILPYVAGEVSNPSTTGSNGRPRVTRTYDSLGRLKTQTEVSGVVTTYTYHSSTGRLQQATIDPPDGPARHTSYEYDGVGNISVVVQPDGSRVTTDYDALRRAVKRRITSSSGQWIATTEVEYAMNGTVYESRVLDENDGIVRRARSLRTPAGLIRRAYRPARNISGAPSVTYEYDEGGRQVASTDPFNVRSEYEYDNDDQLTRHTEAVGTSLERVTERRVYDTLGRLTARFDALGQRTGFEYDRFGRLEYTRFPSTTRPTLGSDGNTNVNDRVRSAPPGPNCLGSDRLCVTDTYGRDGTRFRTWTNARGQVTKHDQPGTDTLFDYDKSGRLTRISYANNSQWTENDYDTLGRLTETRVHHNEVHGSNQAWSIRRQYDNNTGSLTRFEWPDGFAVRYVYDNSGKLTGIRRDSGGSTAYLVRFDHDALGRPEAIRYGATNTAPEATGQITRDEQFGSVTRVSLDFLSGTHADVTFGIDRDDVGRVRVLDVSNDDYVFSDHEPQTQISNGLNQVSRLDGSNVTYNDRGTLRTAAGWTYTHDDLDRLTRASRSGVQVDYSYDPQNRLVERREGGVSEYYLHSESNIVATYDASGNIKERILYSGVDTPLVVWKNGSSVHYVLRDHRGSVVAMVNNVGVRQGYARYGLQGETEIVGDMPSTLYNGGKYDRTTGLYYLRNRWYDPNSGTFLETDPAGNIDGNNLYTFAGADPINFADPTGLFSQGVTPAPTQNYYEAIAAEVQHEILTTGGLNVPRAYSPASPSLATQLTYAGGAVACGVLPGCGEVADIITILNPDTTFTEKSVAVVSLGLSFLTAGATVNASLVTGLSATRAVQRQVVRQSRRKLLRRTAGARGANRRVRRGIASGVVDQEGKPTDCFFCSVGFMTEETATEVAERLNMNDYLANPRGVENSVIHDRLIAEGFVQVKKLTDTSLNEIRDTLRGFAPEEGHVYGVIRSTTSYRNRGHVENFSVNAAGDVWLHDAQYTTQGPAPVLNRFMHDGDLGVQLGPVYTPYVTRLEIYLPRQ